MTTSDMSNFVQQSVEQLWNQGELGLADELFAPNYVNHGGLIPELARGPEAVKLSVVVHRLAFPKLHITVDAHVAQGDTVALRWSAAGADDGRVLEGVSFGRLAGRQIEESWTYWDANAGRTHLRHSPPATARLAPR